MKNNLSTSKSEPALATISVGTIILLPAEGSKKCHTSANSTELVASVGILGPEIVTLSLFFSNHLGSLIISLSLFISPITSPSLCLAFNSFAKSPCNAIATFIAPVLSESLV